MLRVDQRLPAIDPSGGSIWVAALSWVLPLQGRPLQELNARDRARRLGLSDSGRAQCLSAGGGGHSGHGAAALGDADAGAIAAALPATSADALVGRRIDALSGGEQARGWLARVLAGQPQLLLAGAVAPPVVAGPTSVTAVFSKHTSPSS